jgi:4-hydroxythreonine-4-phosphate dehydrogenase
MKRIALTLGDRYGVGPELVARRLAQPAPADAVFVVLADPPVLARGADVAGVALDLPSVLDGTAWPDRSCVLPMVCGLPVDGERRPSAESGREMLDMLDAATRLIQDRKVDALVYAPLNKQAMAMAGHAAGDELDFLSSRFGHPQPAGEINVLGSIWTSRVTSHVPLARVADGISIGSVTAAIRLLHASQSRAGIQPHIAVAALNPHAGEGGLYGTEEREIIGPAVAALRAEGLPVSGPYPSDTVFPRATRDGITAVVTMYHDQGQIALKLMGLGRGVTLLAGMPVPIVTPGHGTAYDIAGQGIARGEGLEVAIELATKLA